MNGIVGIPVGITLGENCYLIDDEKNMLCIGGTKSPEEYREMCYTMFYKTLAATMVMEDLAISIKVPNWLNVSQEHFTKCLVRMMQIEPLGVEQLIELKNQTAPKYIYEAIVELFNEAY